MSIAPVATSSPAMNSKVSPGRKKPISRPHSANSTSMMPSTAHEPIALIMFSGSSQPGRSARLVVTTPEGTGGRPLISPDPLCRG